MSEDVFRELLALVLPRPDAPAGLLGLDRPPEPAGSDRVAALCGDACEVGEGAHLRLAVLRLRRELEDPSCPRLRLVGTTGVEREQGEVGEHRGLPPDAADLRSRGRALLEEGSSRVLT